MGKKRGGWALARPQVRARPGGARRLTGWKATGFGEGGRGAEPHLLEGFGVFERGFLRNSLGLPPGQLASGLPRPFLKSRSKGARVSARPRAASPGQTGLSAC